MHCNIIYKYSIKYGKKQGSCLIIIHINTKNNFEKFLVSEIIKLLMKTY